jgi:hypothetical protein
MMTTLDLPSALQESIASLISTHPPAAPVINSLVHHYTNNSTISNQSPNNKKRKIEIVDLVDNGPQVYSLTNMSVTQPVRKKVCYAFIYEKADVVVYERVIEVSGISFKKLDINQAYALPTPDKMTGHTTVVMIIGTGHIVFGFDHKTNDKNTVLCKLGAAIGRSIVEPSKNDFVSSNGKKQMHAECHIGSKQG